MLELDKWPETGKLYIPLMKLFRVLLTLGIETKEFDMAEILTLKALRVYEIFLYQLKTE
jgi:hypothetical protein